MNREYILSEKLTDEQLWHMLHLQESLYSKEKFTESQIVGILMAEEAKMLSGKGYGKANRLGMALIGATMLAAVAYGASALYDSCTEPRMIQGPRYTEITTLKDNDYKFRRE